MKRTFNILWDFNEEKIILNWWGGGGSVKSRDLNDEKIIGDSDKIKTRDFTYGINITTNWAVIFLCLMCRKHEIRVGYRIFEICTCISYLIVATYMYFAWKFEEFIFDHLWKKKKTTIKQYIFWKNKINHISLFTKFQ